MCYVRTVESFSYDAITFNLDHISRHLGVQEDTSILVLQATPFAERGRVWSHCSRRVVTKERNYRTHQLDNDIS